ncbi:MAG TPA: biopolymer transporter ExbD [Chitinophagaceae bacterium]|nr:biopolymer transporter ExbD [Chitinophagaceae bacterium]
MAQLETSCKSSSYGNKAVRVDLTPMVDLGFLLITFFVFTTTMSKPAALKLNMPVNDNITDSLKVSKKMVLTVMPDVDNKVIVYEGDGQPNSLIEKADLNMPASLRNLIIQKQKKIISEKRKLHDLVIIIKPGKKSTYKNLIDVLDEMMINGVKKYAVVKRSETDEELITKALL